MFLSNLLKLGLHKSSCILFSCLFFVSCNTVSSKPTEVVSNAGSRKIASSSAAMVAINSSAFLAMQACPVLASIQSRVQAGNYDARQIMNMMNVKNYDGKTLQQRLMSELSSNNDCLRRIGELRNSICSRGEYNELCANLDQLDKIDREDFIREFEEFAGASIESIDSNELAGKIEEFVSSKDGFFGRQWKNIVAGFQDAPNPVLLPSLLLFTAGFLLMLTPIGAATVSVSGAVLAVGGTGLYTALTMLFVQQFRKLRR